MKKAIWMILSVCMMLASCTSGSGGGASERGKETANSENNEQSDKANMSEQSTQSEASDEESFGEESLTDNSEQSPEASFVYYAFGDSIAEGYALADPIAQRYPTLFVNNCREINTVHVNHSVSGHKTSDMLSLVKELYSAEKIEEADLITVSIGANNVLGCFLDVMYTLLAQYGSDILSECASAIMGNGDIEKVTSFIKDIEGVFRSEEFGAKLISGINDLKNELPQIFAVLKENNPNAVIMIQTVYNPYKGFSLTVPNAVSFDFDSESDKIVRSINSEIERIANECGAEILDVYTEFENSLVDCVNAGITFFPSVTFNYDPHPNATGHRVIAELLEKRWNELNE